MKVVDLRNIFSSGSDTLIEVTDEKIYYAEEKMEEGHNSLFLLEYNRVTRREKILANYILTDPAYVQHFFSFPEDIVIVMERGRSEAWVLRLNKQTGEEKNMAKVGLIGDFMDCTALDENHVIFYTGPNERHGALLKEYKRLTGFDRVVYLYDIDRDEVCYVRDARICTANPGGIFPFSADGECRLLVLQPHGSEEEKQKCYSDFRWLGDHVDDNVWICPLLDFIVSVRAGEACAPLELIFSAGTQGMVRYAGMDAQNLYFRAGYFPTADQRLCAYEKRTGKKFVAAGLTVQEGETPARFSIEPQGGRAYRIAEDGDYYRVNGVWNTAVSALYPKELGDFITCVDDRFIIARYLLADEKDSFEFHSIYDIQTHTQQSFECSCTVQNGTVVLY